MKKSFGIFIVAAMICAGLISCASTPKTDSGVNESVEKTEQKPKKKEFTKAGFMEDLDAALKDSPEAALALYDKIPSQYADDFDLLFLKAAICVSAKDLAQAKELCALLSERDPNNTDVMQLAATIARMEGNKAERQKQLNAMLAKDKYAVGANIEFGQDAVLQKNYRNAKTYYTRALAKEPYNREALFGMGQVNYYLEQDDLAKDYFNRILEKHPDYAPAYSYLGKLASADNEYLIASRYAKKALDLDPENYEYNMEYGMAERYLGHFDSAIEAWTKAISIEPDYFLAYAYRAGLYDEESIFDKALADYKMVIKLNPEYYYAYEAMGILALHERDFTNARIAFSKCREKNLENISYPLMITYCYYMEGNKVEAKNYSDKILRKMNRNSIEYAMLRLFHDERGELPMPQRIAQVTNSNLRGKMYYYLALFYDMFGHDDFAKEYYTKVISMNSPMYFEYRLAEWRIGKVN